MEKFGNFKFRIYKKTNTSYWHYQIFYPDETILRESYETYAFEGIARLAVIGHIALLEQKKG